MLRRLLALCLVILLVPLSGCTDGNADEADTADATSTATPSVTTSGATAGNDWGRPAKVELLQDGATHSGAWVARVFATTDGLPVDDYRILVSTPEGTIRIEPDRSALHGGSLVWTADTQGLDGDTIDARPLRGDEETTRPLYRLEHRDAASDAVVSARDLWTLRYGIGDGMRALPPGAYTLTLVHADTDVVAGTLATTMTALSDG